MMIKPIVISCPRCHRPLPPLNAAFELDEDLQLTLMPILCPPYLAAAKRAHPHCIDQPATRPQQETPE